MSEDNRNFAKSLAAGGEKLDLEIRVATKNLIKTFPKVNLFLIAISQSLIWIGHAIDKSDYFKKSIDFLNSGPEKALSGLSECFGRYGSEGLQATLVNWRKLYAEINVPFDLLKSNICL